MPEFRRIYLDTNVLIQIFEGAGELSDLLREMIQLRFDEASPLFATSELTLAELLVVPFRNKDDPLINRYDSFLRPSGYLDIVPVERPVMWCAAVLRAADRRLKLPDAIHLSAAIGAQCSHFLTGDRRLGPSYEVDNQRYGETRGPARLDVLPLDAESIHELTAGVSGP